MHPSAPRARPLAIAALAIAAACAQAPELSELPPPALPADAAPAVTLETAEVVAGHVVVTWALSDRGAPITGVANAAALVPTWTLAWLDTEPVSGLPAWRGMIYTGPQVIPSLPPAGPGTPALEVLTAKRQNGGETAGALAELGDGRFTYTFVDGLPSGHPLGAKLRVGLYLQGAAAGTAATSATLDFVPDGSTVEPYGSVTDERCNGCHGLVSGHGGKRVGVKLCLTCHTWNSADPDTVDPAAMSLGADTSDVTTLNARAAVTKGTFPNPLELGRLIHRIHRGSALPTLYRSSSCYTSSTKTGVTQLTSTSTVLCNVASLPPTFPPDVAPAPPPAPPADLPWTVPALPFRAARNAIGPAGLKASLVGEGGVELVIGRIASRVVNNQAARTLATGIGYPQDLRNCAACHVGPLDSGPTVESISRRTCSGCHPDVWFGPVATPADLDAFHMPHSGGPQADDTACADCHVSKVGNRWAPIADLHSPPVVSPRWKKPKLEIVEVQNLKPGSPGAPGPATATVRFKAWDGIDSRVALTPLGDPTPAADPDPVSPSPVPRKLTSVTIRIAGPNTDYVTGGGVESVTGTPAAPAYTRAFSLAATCTQSILTLEADSNGVFTCTFANPLANLNLDAGVVEAAGYWTVAMEGRRASTATQHTVPPPYTCAAKPCAAGTYLVTDWPWYGWNLAYDYLGDTFRWPGTGETVTEAADNVFAAVDLATGRIATAPSAARRSIVDMTRCNACHLRLSLHGQRNDTRMCVFCHAPDVTDRMYRPRDLRMAPVGTGAVLLWNPLAFPAKPANAWEYYTADGIEERSISIKTMVHRIHTGEREGAASLEGIRPYLWHTSAANVAFLDEARFPNALANCEACHLPDTWTIESVPADAAPTAANEKPAILHVPDLDALGYPLTASARAADGSAWTAGTMPTGNYGSVAAHGTTFAAVGASVAATSPDGATWTARTIPAGSYAAVASNGTTLVAVGASVAATSPNGIDWTARTLTGSFAGVAWGGSTFAAIGTNAAATSPDGATWTAATIPAGTYSGIAWGASTFVAVGSSVAATSPDGATWTARTIPTGTYASVAWSGTTFVAVGASALATSPDGVTWTSRAIPVATWRGVAWGGGRFAAVGAGVAASSPDGITWTWRHMPAGTQQKVAWNGSTFAAVGYATAVSSGHGPSEATPAVTSACLTCHTNGAAAEHAAGKTSGGVEQCASCHGEGGAESVRKHHAVP
jgi:hypothetical protein